MTLPSQTPTRSVLRTLGRRLRHLDPYAHSDMSPFDPFILQGGSQHRRILPVNPPSHEETDFSCESNKDPEQRSRTPPSANPTHVKALKSALGLLPLARCSALRGRDTELPG